MAQDPSPPSQSGTRTQNPATGDDSIRGSDTTTAPPPATPINPEPVKPAGFLRLPPIKRPPITPAYVPNLKVSAGYSVTSLGTPSSGRAVLDGMDASIAADTGRRIGAKFDLSYVRAANAFSTGHHMDVLTYLIGPVFSVWNSERVSIYADALGGGARVAGPFANASGGLNVGHVHYPAWAVGSGAEYRLSLAFGFRVNVDFLHTHFYNSSGVIRGQNDVRVVNSIVYYVGQPIRQRRRE